MPLLIPRRRRVACEQSPTSTVDRSTRGPLITHVMVGEASSVHLRDAREAAPMKTSA